MKLSSKNLSIRLETIYDAIIVGVAWVGYQQRFTWQDMA
jgi:hypothetical protein